MYIDYVMAWTIEEGDMITLGDDTVFKVFKKEDEGDMVILTLEDEDGEREPFTFKDVETIAVLNAMVD